MDSGLDNRPIGVFDSGLGGLTAVRELRKLLPQEDIVYFGDTGRVPYGTRGRDIIIKYADQDVRFLQSRGVKLIMAACGTVSSVAGDLGKRLPVPFTDVLRATAQAAARATRNRRVAVIGTTATIRSGSYRRALAALDPAIEIFEADCPLFVPLVENGFIKPEEEITRLVAERYLAPLREAGPDTLILGCTHYPILRPFIQSAMGDAVALIDSGREAARSCAAILERQGLLSGGRRQGSCSFFVSDSVEDFSRVGGIFLGGDVGGTVRHIEIDAF